MKISACGELGEANAGQQRPLALLAHVLAEGPWSSRRGLRRSWVTAIFLPGSMI
jgi:hypothetical protein